jgi:DNA invertase Pin-like site-specific DNA recombinase
MSENSQISLGPNSYILPLEHSALTKESIVGYAYLRCSTQMQVKEHGSVEAQLAAIERYVLDKNITLVAAYVDAAVSGKTDWTDRVALSALVSKLKKNNVVVCYDVTRLGRDAADTLGFVKQLGKKGKEVSVHITTIGDITGIQKTLFGVMAVLAEQERDDISARVKNAMRLLSEKGELKCRPKFGESHNGTKHGYEPDPEAIKVLDYLRKIKAETPEISYRAMTRAVNEKFDASMFRKKAWYPTDIIRYCKANNI